MKSVNLVITGNVQGVFFRASAKEAAEQLNIKGFAKNQSDGSVFIEAEGDDENVKRFVEWCRQGPPRAEVTNVEIRESELRNFTTFEIRR